MDMSYEDQRKLVIKGLILLAIVTVVEVLIALVGNGHVFPGFELPKFIMYPLMIGLSLYKAYFIVYNFMHLAFEVKGMALSILLPMLLLVWAVVAFFHEGNAWGERRALIENKNDLKIEYKAQDVQESITVDSLMQGAPQNRERLDYDIPMNDATRTLDAEDMRTMDPDRLIEKDEEPSSLNGRDTGDGIDGVNRNNSSGGN